ncbi:tripartite tricarboxylate transporter substrate binding protein [Pseudoruegeria sp. SK021]|uniref:Bug family tripartite tricarboxylate transporter substrate binding protein n=1 Tax=Pseudoruegeria sp. SK021 TaxID=1933035 RepID=UPI000A254857|nr:tripartite tricarboxylate transporter substrate binding protein [Pseudoruegeria sp. SK021]OSP56378.1 hypothetical protein BV911_03590 [Pseudoruegeria sp. SK021]
MFTRFLKTAAVAALLSPLGGLVHADDYPSRNIEMMFPWGPGSAFAMAQIITNAMGEELDTNITVVSTPGAAGVKSFNTVQDDDADGYTLLDGWVAPLILQPLAGNTEFTYQDFTPLWSATRVPFAIVVRKDDERFPDYATFIEYLKENPGKARYSSGSIGNIPHMVIAKLLQTEGVYARNIPYPQDGDAFKDLRGGLLDFSFNDPITFQSNKDAFKTLVAFTNEDDVAAAYDDETQTLDDLGLDIGLTGLAPSGWNWFLVHKDTPDDIVATLNTAMEAALLRPDVQEKLKAAGFLPTMYSPDQYEEIVGPIGDQIAAAKDAIAWEAEQLKK